MVDVAVMIEIEAMASRLGVDLSTIHLDSIRLHTDDDLGIVSDDEEIYQEDSQESETRFVNIIVADNIPIVPREKFEKLEGGIRKIYSQIWVIKEDGLWMHVDPDTEKTLAIALLSIIRLRKLSLLKRRHVDTSWTASISFL